MISQIIEWCAHNRFLVFTGVLLLTLTGIWSMGHIPLDAANLDQRLWTGLAGVDESRDAAGPAPGCALRGSQVSPRPLSCPSVSRTIALRPERPANNSRAARKTDS